MWPSLEKGKPNKISDNQLFHFLLFFILDDANDEESSYDARNDEEPRSSYEQPRSK